MGRVPLVLLALCPAVLQAGERSVTISNAEPRLDQSGAPLNAHSGNVVEMGGRYFLYGEWYGTGPYVVPGNTQLPRLAVYHSTDMVHWEFGGLLHNNTSPGWAASGLWPGAAEDTGTWWCPWAVYSEARRKIVLWWTATPGACCDAYWGVAESDDGVHFVLVSLNETGAGHLKPPRSHPAAGAMVNPKDGNAVLIDDDGTGYIAYTAIAPSVRATGESGDHMVAIERLSSDLLHSTKVQVGELFPDDFVEGVMLFKRQGTYYLIYSSCCCACRGGSGAVVHRATNISGPWTRQSKDVNCAADAPVCAAPGWPKEDRPTDVTVHAQGLGLSVIAGQYIWQGERWLSAPHNPSNCSSLCSSPTGDCAQPAAYIKGYDFSYWIPLQFDQAGAVEQFEPFVDSWTLELTQPQPSWQFELCGQLSDHWWVLAVAGSGLVLVGICAYFWCCRKSSWVDNHERRLTQAEELERGLNRPLKDPLEDALERRA